MSEPSSRPLRCAIYTRKSTEHGLELEFNSLHAQREACAAYIKSQKSARWVQLVNHYDDAAYSGGSLERPAVRQLLDDIQAGKIDVVVVYKIDRLTRSLTDFARLVEIFDKKSVSFVAVTQQFNTTTSMGRLTLNVLLSFAQFERELSSERVKDKIAASKKKGKWMGGSVPLGYDVKNKKLIINSIEAKAVRYIFSRYLELGSFRLLTEDLNLKGIITKLRSVSGRTIGGTAFTYGPLAYLLKNRTYIGETSHSNSSFAGEHEPIIEKTTFDAVQALLQNNSIKRHNKRSNGDALLIGRIFDDRGNRMSPSFSTKKGVRYRFYVSSAILRGRREGVGSITRISAIAAESQILTFLRRTVVTASKFSDRQLIIEHLNRVEFSQDGIAISVKNPENDSKIIKSTLPSLKRWSAETRVENPSTEDGRSQILIQAIVRARNWLSLLETEKFTSIEDLARSVNMHPKVIRGMLRFAFLGPNLMAAILNGSQPRVLDLKKLKGATVLSWREQQLAIGLHAKC